jgi:hypothetical protein
MESKQYSVIIELEEAHHAHRLLSSIHHNFERDLIFYLFTLSFFLSLSFSE